MAHAHAAHDDGHAHESHAHSPSHYIKIWVVLCVLLVVSILGPEIGIKIVTLITAFGIAFVKAYLVMKHFMHLDVERPFVWYILATGLAFMVLFFAGVSVDVMNHAGARWNNVAAEHEVARGMKAGDTSGHHGEEHADAGHADAGHAAEPAAAGHDAAPAAHEAAPAAHEGEGKAKAKAGKSEH